VKNKEISGLEEKHKKQEKIYEDSILKMKEEYKVSFKYIFNVLLLKVNNFFIYFN